MMALVAKMTVRNIKTIMRTIRVLLVAALTAALSLVAQAQVTGPTPLAWRWAQPTNISPYGSPVVDGNQLYVAVSSRVYCVDREMGTQKWKYPIAEGIDGSFVTGVLLTSDTLVAAGDNETVYGINPANGQEKWVYKAPAAVISAPVSVGKLIVLALADDTLMAINSNDGTAAWQTAYHVFDHLNGHIASFNNNVLYFTQKNVLFSLNVNNMRPDWKQAFSVISADTTPVVFGDVVYVNNGEFVVSVSANSGAPRWQRNMGEGLAFSPAVSAEGVAVVSRDGKLFWLNPTNGQFRRPLDANGKTPVDARNRPLPYEPLDLGSGVAAQPCCYPGVIIIPSSEGALNMYNSTSQQLIWSFPIRPYTSGLRFKVKGASGETEKPLLALPAAGPAVINGSQMFVLSQDGSVLGFDAKFGVDLTAPQVKMAWPNAGSQVNGQQLEVVFQIEDESTGINEKTLKIEANGVTCDYEFGRDGVAVVRFSSAGKNGQLRNGKAMFKVTCGDWFGNTATSTFYLSIDNSLKPVGKPADKPGVGGGPGGGKGPGGGGGSGGSGG